MRQLTLFILVLLLGATTGCHRADYRRRADAQAYELVQQKANNPHWALPDYTIEISPQSRMYSPFNPDRPPMPPDDPAAHQLMRRVDHKPGYPYWDINGHTRFVENPDWLAFVPLDQDGILTLDADTAVRLARMNSPLYQRELEDLYLSALDVSFERFIFDSQFFAGYSGDFTADGRDRPGGGGESRSVLDIGFFSLGQRPVAWQKFGVTGSSLVVGLANRLIWQYSGPDTHTATTLLDFSFIQPLLRNAGRDRIMERLTLSERSLLANVRQMERFRRGFYLEVMTGVDSGPGPTRRGGVFGGSGLGGFTGLGGGGFGQLVQGGGGGGGGAGTGAGQAGGYIGLLQLQKTIRNQEINVSQLRSSLTQFQEFYLAGRIDRLQVQQAEQALYNAQSSLINNQTRYNNDLDEFKITVGLPTPMEVKVEDTMLNSFNLLDPAIEQPQNELSRVQQEVGRLVISILNSVEVTEVDDMPVETLRWSDTLEDQLQEIRRLLVQAEGVRQRVLAQNVTRAEGDINQLRSSLDRRVSDLNFLRERVAEDAARNNKPPYVASAVLDDSDLLTRSTDVQDLLADSIRRMTGFSEPFQKIDGKLTQLLNSGKDLMPSQLARAVRRWLLLRDTDGEEGEMRVAPPFETPEDKDLAPLTKQLSDLAFSILELSLVQARARADSITLVPIDLDSNLALKIASDFRRDWMNSRAALVDAWRLIEFNADNLESTLDVVFEGDISNVGDNPLDLRDSTGRLRAGIQFDAPITRLDERNTYRQSLIEYQQARRGYYVFRDQVARGLRNTLRAIELNQLNFELRRSAIRVAIEQVELARLRLQEPPRPEAPPDQQLGATTARDLVSALSDLLDAQNDFISVWVTYEVLRRSLDFSLGTMQLDGDGLWLDPGPLTAESGYPQVNEYHAASPDLYVLPHSPQSDAEAGELGEIIPLPPVTDSE